MSGQHEVPIKVTLSVLGSFHAYRLAAQIECLGILERIYTSNLRSVANVPRRKVRNYFPIAAVKYAVDRFTPFDVSHNAGRVYDALVAQFVKRMDSSGGRLFHGWAQFSLLSIQTANKHGIPTLLERSCPHISFQKALIEEHAARQGLRPPSRKFLSEGLMVEEYEEAKIIVIPSSYSYGSFVLEGVSPSKLRIVPLGADRIDPIRRSRADDKIFRVLYVGGNPIRKGLGYLLKAWGELKLPQSELLLRGSVPPELEGLTDSPTIRVIPKLSKEGLYDLYRMSTIFCLPSVDDGFGMAVLEAMSFGLPIIISENVGARDVTRDGADGFVIPTGDKEAIKEKIEFFYKNREAIESMGQVGFERSRELSWEAYGERMLRVYRDAIRL